MTDSRAPPAKPPGPPRVLIIEDEMLIASLVEATLHDLGYTVSGIATTIAAARQELAKGNFDAVLLDIGLDGHSSAEVADVLLDMAIPIAFVTGYDGPVQASHADVPVLGKPFTSEQLGALLERLTGPSHRQNKTALVEGIRGKLRPK
jgi:DNA-binding response OmpR family regulator